jgi:hypothetical protein
VKISLGLLITIFGIAGAVSPAFAQSTENNTVTSSSQPDRTKLLQLQQKIASLQAQQASLPNGSSGTNGQTSKVQLQDEINTLQKRVSYLQSVDAQRGEKNAHMVKEMGING